MYRVTFETNRGNFSVVYEEFDMNYWKVGMKAFVKSPFYKKCGTYKIIKIQKYI